MDKEEVQKWIRKISELPIFINISGGRTSGHMAYLFKDDILYRSIR